MFIISTCNHPKRAEVARNEIFQTEKAFEKMTRERGVAEAFYYFADDSAVIKRENDTLIRGREGIRKYYEKRPSNATVNWTPDYIEVSECGNLGYTYGKYTWKIRNDKDSTIVYTGVFHTVWKRQPDRTWKYVWD
jgi:ketosteroid isomerase-like protein